MSSQPVTAILVGAGNRGTVYASYAMDFPEKLTIIAVADPKSAARSHIQDYFGILPELCCSNWADLALLPKMADCAIIATGDSLHKEVAVAFAKLKYHILLEKPMAVTKEDCLDIVRACEENEIILTVCHVLRYLPPVLAIRECIESGAIGKVVNVNHTEKVGFWHFAHSFVRGNWRNMRESSFSLLTKCCHDVDLIKFWMTGKKCLKISSFGSLFHFKEKNKPLNAGSNCLNCDIEDICAYSAKKIYLDSYDESAGTTRWIHSVVCDPCANYKEELARSLEHGPYGRCVYSCDNDVCDNQTVQFLYDDGSTSTLTMIAFTEKVCQRETKIFGTQGEIFWNGEGEGPVIHHDFLTGITSSLPLKNSRLNTGRLKGHGGADFYLMNAFVEAVSADCQSGIQTTAADALESHLLVFAAEESRNKGTVIDYPQYKAQIMEDI